MDGKPARVRLECVTKQPFLTGFPLTVFASAKRRLQAAIRRSSAIITHRSLSGYAVLFEDLLPGDFLSSIDPTRASAQLRPSAGILGLARPDP